MGWIAGAFALAGAAAGIISWIRGENKAEEAARRQREEAEAKKKRELALMDAEWAADVKKANEHADKADRATTLEEAVLGPAASAQLGLIGQEQKNNALAYNIAAINAGANKGGANAALGASGTRASSALQATQMQDGIAQKQLQQQEDTDRKRSDISLMSAMNSLVMGGAKLQEQRTDANKLRADYAPGGDTYGLYKLKRSNFEADSNAVIEHWRRQEDEHRLSWDDPVDWLSGITAGFGGASTGMQYGSQVGKFTKNWNRPRQVMIRSSAPNWNSLYGIKWEN